MRYRDMMWCLMMDLFISYYVNVFLMIRRFQNFKYLGALTDDLPHVTHHIYRLVKPKVKRGEIAH